jgi:hypothetical protein
MTVPAPASDAEVARFARDLGIPGIIDVHVHFLPPRMMRSVWRYFDGAGPLVGREWPIAYRWPEEQRVARLHGMGVRLFGALAYAHRPDMAADLTAWTMGFAGRTPGCLPSLTFYPEPGVAGYVGAAMSAGAAVGKLHLQVADFDPADDLLDPVWGMLAEAGLPVVVHAGSGPVAHGHTGPGPLERVLRRHPDLTLVVAHLGAPEYAGFFALARRYPRVVLDTTMVATDFFNEVAEIPAGLLPDLAALGRDGKILLGSDFPNIPYPYAHQLAALHRLGFGDDFLRAVCWDAPLAVLGPRGEAHLAPPVRYAP